MNKKVILDLCGGTGSWSKPWVEAGYKVYNITLPDFDVRQVRLDYKNGIMEFPNKKQGGFVGIARNAVYGILAAPPCTMFSFARTKAKKPRDLKEGMECVRACLDIIYFCNEVSQATTKKTLPLKFWALENPYHGFLKQIIGKPAFTFDPWEFGDGYQKRTALWGNFSEPKKSPVPHNLGKFDYLKSKDIHPEHFGEFDRQTRRSITPAKFAKAFYKANSLPNNKK